MPLYDAIDIVVFFFFTWMYSLVHIFVVFVQFIEEIHMQLFIIKKKHNWQ